MHYCQSIRYYIMIKANRLIFPRAGSQASSTSYPLHLQDSIICIPKEVETPVGCFCQTITHHTQTSTATTARTLQQVPQKPIITIRPAKKLNIKVTSNTHKRSSTKILNLVTNIQKNQSKPELTHCQTAREPVINHFEDQLFSRKVQQYLHKRQDRFLSDDLYHQSESQSIDEKASRVAVPVGNIKLERNEDSQIRSRIRQYKIKDKESFQNTVPCLFLEVGSEKVLLYFHGNGEDILTCEPFLRAMAQRLSINILAVQYPGYSIYKGSPSCEEVEKNAVEVVQFLMAQGVALKDMIVMGRSIGSGPATHISSLFPVGALVLLSPFLSLCDVVGDIYGSMASWLLKQRFNNKQRVQSIVSPCLMLHGIRDRLIPQRHTTELCKYFKSYCRVKLINNMTHSVFNQEELFSNVRQFIKSVKLT